MLEALVAANDTELLDVPNHGCASVLEDHEAAQITFSTQNWLLNIVWSGAVHDDESSTGSSANSLAIELVKMTLANVRR